MKYLYIILLLCSALSASAATNGYYRGDIDGSNTITIADLSQFINLLRTTPADMPKAADVNADGSVDIQDASALIAIILGKAEMVWVPLTDPLITDGTTTSGGVNESEYGGEFDAKVRK